MGALAINITSKKWEEETVLSAIDISCQKGSEWDEKFTHGNSDQRNKRADRSHLGSLLKADEREELLLRIISFPD